MEKILKNVKNNYILFLRLWMAYLVYLLICSGVYLIGNHLSMNENNTYYNAIIDYYNSHNNIHDSNLMSFYTYFSQLATASIEIHFYNRYTIIPFILMYLIITFIIMCFCGNSKKVYFDNIKFLLVVFLFSFINMSYELLSNIPNSTNLINNRIQNNSLINCMLKEQCYKKFKIVNNIYSNSKIKGTESLTNDYNRIVFVVTTNKWVQFGSQNENESKIIYNFVNKYGSESDLINFRNISESSN